MKIKALALEMQCLEFKYKKYLDLPLKLKKQFQETISCQMDIFSDLLEGKTVVNPKNYDIDFEETEPSIITNNFYKKITGFK